MNAKEIVNQVKTLLGMEVKLATMKLSDGVTVLEAEMFEAGAEVFVLAEDQKIALPVGEYELEDGKILVVQQEGIIAEIKEAEVKEEMPEVEAEPQVEVEVEAEAEVAKTNQTPNSTDLFNSAFRLRGISFVAKRATAQIVD